MNLLTLFMPLVNILFSITGVLYTALLFFDAVMYDLVAYSFKVFLLMSTVNLNTLYGIVSPIVDRLEAVIIVFIVYQLGIAFINYMLKPDDFVQDGTKLLRNLFIATALFVSYNFIFNVFNELNVVMLGNPSGNYKYQTLSQLFDLNSEESVGQNDHGILTTFVFGRAGLEGKEPGQSMALSIASIFIRDKGSQSETSSRMIGVVMNRNNGRFIGALPSLSDEIDNGTIEYTYLIGFFVAAFVVYSIFNMSIQIGVRMFKLLILQMVTPIVILDVIKNGLEGKFKTFCQKYLSIFIEAFTRVLTLLITTVFVSKFLGNIVLYFPTLETPENAFTRGLIMVITTIAAYTFCGQVPKFIDEVLGTSMASGDTKNFLGGLLGAGVGAVTGFAGGLAGGGIGGAIAGLTGGIASGAASGAKGNTIADMFKTGSESFSGMRTKGQTIRYNGGLGSHMAGHIPLLSPALRNAQDRRINEYDSAVDKINEYDTQTSSYIKQHDWRVDDSTKFDGGATDSDYLAIKALYNKYLNGSAAYEGTKYSDISGVTIGDNKDAFCATMLDKSEKVAEAKKDIEKYKAAGDEAKLQQAYLDLEHAKRLSNDAAGDFFDAVKSHVGQNTTVGQRYLKSATDAMKKVGISHDVKDIKFVKKAKNKVSTAKQEYTSRGSYSRQHPVDRGGK